MAKIRSPNYPMLDLGAALVATRKAFEKDNRNKMSRAALAKHLGHDSLSGPALTKLGALRAYGLIDGKGDEIKITDDAVHALMAPDGSPERSAAMLKLATQPKLFQEIRKDFSTPPSADNLKFWLVKRQFASDAAEKATKTYLATMRLVEGGEQEYDYGEEQASEIEKPMTPQAHKTVHHELRPSDLTPASPVFGTPKLTEVFNLDEGQVTLSVPATLSPESYQDMADRIEIFLRGLKRRAYAEAARRRADREDVAE
jgi:hypothetical protein